MKRGITYVLGTLSIVFEGIGLAFTVVLLYYLNGGVSIISKPMLAAIFVICGLVAAAGTSVRWLLTKNEDKENCDV